MGLNESGKETGSREKLVLAGAVRFMRFGFHGTSIDHILADSGVARSNFYYHFRSKDELAIAVTRHWMDAYNEMLIEPALGSAERVRRSAPDRLRRLYEIAGSTQGADGDLVGCPLGRLSAELSTEMPDVQILLDDYFKVVRNRICDVLLADPELDLQLAEARSLASMAVAILEGGLLLGGLRSDGNEVRTPGFALADMISGGGRNRL